MRSSAPGGEAGERARVRPAPDSEQDAGLVGDGLVEGHVLALCAPSEYVSHGIQVGIMWV